ncbi:nuclear transport factor 2 family protein [Mycobacterium montefiorense]|uniref:nuclear transport factor 2 family protein n=1 Tax=Mycobacterium montefiorense TaxID=154654 RepID=UPI0021DF35AF|nr:nuclear transport factor 2 family protein [Mycobacterium montefiorense]MCV7427621.1 nuclear transport factor 2 family protein [Mycobacterium montefiorense]GLE50620.1 hypothetical protein ATCCBAA256_02120 [Mycobacterium montefiorense]
MISSGRAALEFICLRFGNDEPLYGLADVSARTAGLLSAVSALSHSLCETWVHTDTVICEVAITYERRDGSQITLPCIDVFRVSNGLIADYRGPLFTTAT